MSESQETLEEFCGVVSVRFVKGTEVLLDESGLQDFLDYEPQPMNCSISGSL